MESISGQDADDVEILSLNYNSDDESQKVNNSLFTDYNNISIENNFERGVKNAEVINLDDCSSNSNSFSTKKLNENGNSNNTYSDITPNLSNADLSMNSDNDVMCSNGDEKTSCTTDESQEKCDCKESSTEQGQQKAADAFQEVEKKDLNSSVDNQVQCINLHCQSGFDLAEAPVFALTYFGVRKRKNVFQKVCCECFGIALRHQEKLCNLLKNDVPLMYASFPKHKDDVVVMDSVEEIYEEEILPESIISLVEEQLVDLVKKATDKYNINFQLEVAQEILVKKYEDLTVSKKNINDELNSIENKLKETRSLIYKAFTPRIKHLPDLNLLDVTDRVDKAKRKRATKTVSEIMKESPILPKSTSSITSVSPLPEFSNSESHDVVALREIELPKVKLPPIGKIIYPKLDIGAQVFVIKATVFGVWLKAKVVEILSKTEDGSTTYRVRLETSYRGGTHKTVTGKQLAYRKPSRVRYPVGTRVIALFRNTESPGKDAYYAGVIAEPPKVLNMYRYLVFFDDGYAQYVTHDKIHLVCECSKFVYEDVHSDSRDFIKNYLGQYPERPMVKLQQGQIVKTEWNGKWWTARVFAVDGSLAKMYFEVDGRTEWIYRGSTRLGPLYSELVAAAARKEQGALSRHRSLGIASLKKRNMPYVEYSVDQDDAKSPQTPTASKNVAKKSTALRPSSHNEIISEKPTGPPKPNEKVEYTSKGYIRTMQLSSRIPGRIFVPHQCGLCTNWNTLLAADLKGINPLAVPLIFGFERQIARYKAKKTVMYRAPCGRRLRNIVEMHRYLRITKCPLGLDYFDFDHWVRALDEFHLEPNMYCTHVKDISYGHENTPVSCVNEINHSWPSFMDYSTSRIPQEGVNICFDEEFLVCCSCTDDCLDKEKCECWQLTIEGTKLGPGGQVDPNVGYHYKRLLEPVTTGIYECNQRCKCGPTCLNRVAQHPLKLNLQVFRTLRKGWGLRTLNDIPQGSFICIYAGRLHTEQSANDDGRMYGDEYLAELDYIEVVERFKEGYESEVIEPDVRKGNGHEHEGEDADDCQDEQDELDESQMNSDDMDYVPQGLSRLPNTENVVNTRGRNKKITSEEKSESEGEKEKEEDAENDKESFNADDDDDEMKKKPSKFTADVSVGEENEPKHKSVREMFGDGADDCYIMDAKSSGNIGRYLNHSCQPNVFVQNVFVDTHDVRFPWVAFFALTYIRAGTELTWDYNYDIGSVPDKVLYCYCNSAECRGRLL